MYQYIWHKNQASDRKNCFYADVNYCDKEKAKKRGALWDYDRKLWYFTTEEARHQWDVEHSSDIYCAKENKSHKYIALLEIDYALTAYRNILAEKGMEPIEELVVIIFDTEDYSIVRIGKYNIAHSRFPFNRNPAFIINCSRNEAIADIIKEFNNFGVTQILTFEGKHQKNTLKELDVYDWYDVKPFVCKQYQKPRKSGFNQLFRPGRRFRYATNTASSKLRAIFGFIKQNKPINNFFNDKIQ